VHGLTDGFEVQVRLLVVDQLDDYGALLGHTRHCARRVALAARAAARAARHAAPVRFGGGASRQGISYAKSRTTTRKRSNLEGARLKKHVARK
jgi:hypothetical protein